MADLNDMRQIYPEYADLPDNQLVDKLWEIGKKDYWSMGKAKFALSLGHNPPTQRQAETQSMKSLEADPPDYEGISKLERDTKGWVAKPYVVGTGAALGGALGGILGGLPTAGLGAGPMGALGGMAGAGAASAAYDVGENVYRKFLDDPTPRPEPDGPWIGPMKRAATEGALDLGMSAVLPNAGRALRTGVAKLVGTRNPESRRLAESALSQGIELTPTHVSKYRWPKGITKMLSVFPFIHGVYSDRQTRLLGQLDDRAAQLMSELAPTATLYDASRDAVQTAKKRLTKYDNISASLYNRFWNAVRKAGDPAIVPTREIKNAIIEIDKRTRREMIQLDDGTILRRPGDSGALEDYVNHVFELPSHITVGEARGLERQLNDQLRDLKGVDFDTVLDIKKGLELAKNSLDFSKSNLPQPVRSDILQKWKAANSFYHDARNLWDSPVAQKFGTVDRKLRGFEHGYFKPGSKNADQIFSEVWNDKSIDALSDLKKIVGENQYKQGIQQYIRKAFDNSIVKLEEGNLTTDQFSTQKFKKILGLDSREGKQFFKAALGDELATAWDDFLEVAEKATDLKIGDPSTFMLRRAILGSSVIGSVFLGAGNVSVPASLAISGLAWLGARGLTNPKKIRQMTRLIDPDTPQQQLKMLAGRLTKASIDDAYDDSDRESEGSLETKIRDTYEEKRALAPAPLQRVLP